MNCPICDRPMDEFAAERLKEFGEGFACSSCSDPKGSLLEILNYFRIPVQETPLERFNDDGSTEVVEFPDPKNPALWHAKAVKLFKGWKPLIEDYCRLKNIKSPSYLTVEDVRGLAEYAKSKAAPGSVEGSYLLASLDAVREAVRADLSAEAINVLRKRKAKVESPPLLGDLPSETKYAQA